MAKIATRTSVTHRVRTAREIGLLIRDRRKRLHIDQAALAKRVGVSRQWVIAIEQGKSGAEIGLVLQTMNALDLVLAVEVETLAGSTTTPRIRKFATKASRAPIDINAIIDRARDRE